jgi:transglutaminase-like putative cysteine protease
MNPPRTHARPRAFLPALCLLATAFAPAYARGDKDWKPIDPAQLSSAAPAVQKDADAEALFWEVYVDDSQAYELSLRHYIRIKVFNERGRDSQSKVDLPYYSYNQIKDVAARVIKPDGSIVELKKEDVFERTVVKASGLKVKAKTFALPGVEPGSIIEYRWREVYPGASANRMRLQFQRDIPVQNVTYYLKPYPGMHYRPFNVGDARFVKDKDGFSKMTMTNMPAFREEARMPPENSVRSWVFLFYTSEDRVVPERYWSGLGRGLYEAFKDELKADDDVKAAAGSIVGDASAPEEKLRRIYDFCRTKIKNTSDDASGMTAEERSKLKENKSPSDTLKRGMGSGSDIDHLFGALARAAGFDARLALAGDNADLFFTKDMANASFLGSSFIAVRVGDAWQFYSPAETYTPFGMLGWREEGQDALITDPKDAVWARTPTAGPEQSVERRKGKFTLSEDGTLEGDVTMEYTGHLAYDRKEYNDDDTPAEREKTLQEMIKGRMAAAELSDIRIENVTDPVKSFLYAFHVKVPGYAQRTGKRLFIQPSFFQHGLAAMFQTSARANGVYFHYTWSEEDKVEITLPEGYALENPESPAIINAGGVSRYEPVAQITSDGRTLIWGRKFNFGAKSAGGGAPLLFPVESYGTLKNYFDAVNTQDATAIALKQGAPAAAKK